MNMSPDPFLGKMIHGYTLEECLGRGSVTAVYLARTQEQASVREIIVTVPILPEELSANSRTLFRERFRQTAERLVKLRNPHLLPYYGHGEDGDQLYLLTPHVDGELLALRLHNQPQWQPEEVLPLLRPLATALDYLHTRGFVYEYLNPTKILLPSKYALQITGTGLSQMLSLSGLETGHTSPFLHLRSMAGTYLAIPEYLAPEIVRGAPVDGRADIYSLGVIIYELLAGRPPFRGQDYFDTALQHIRQPLPSLHEASPSVPVAIELLLNKALHRNPKYRFKKAIDLVEAYERVLRQRIKSSLFESSLNTVEQVKMIAGPAMIALLPSSTMSPIEEVEEEIALLPAGSQDFDALPQEFPEQETESSSPPRREPSSQNQPKTQREQQPKPREKSVQNQQQTQREQQPKPREQSVPNQPKAPREQQPKQREQSVPNQQQTQREQQPKPREESVPNQPKTQREQQPKPREKSVQNQQQAQREQQPRPREQSVPNQQQAQREQQPKPREQSVQNQQTIQPEQQPKPREKNNNRSQGKSNQAPQQRQETKQPTAPEHNQQSRQKPVERTSPQEAPVPPTIHAKPSKELPKPPDWLVKALEEEAVPNTPAPRAIESRTTGKISAADLLEEDSLPIISKLSQEAKTSNSITGSMPAIGPAMIPSAPPFESKQPRVNQNKGQVQPDADIPQWLMDDLDNPFEDEALSSQEPPTVRRAPIQNNTAPAPSVEPPTVKRQPLPQNQVQAPLTPPPPPPVQPTSRTTMQLSPSWMLDEAPTSSVTPQGNKADWLLSNTSEMARLDLSLHPATAQPTEPVLAENPFDVNSNDNHLSTGLLNSFLADYEIGMPLIAPEDDEEPEEVEVEQEDDETNFFDSYEQPYEENLDNPFENGDEENPFIIPNVAKLTKEVEEAEEQEEMEDLESTSLNMSDMIKQLQSLKEQLQAHSKEL